MIEAALLGLFMVSACGFAWLLYHPGSPIASAIRGDLARRGFMGTAMGLTAVALIYSPWGKQSGAHMNPALTLNFLRLGKIAPWDAAFYCVFQCVGGALGVLLMRSILGEGIADRSVNYVLTLPGPHGEAAALTAEVMISGGMMLMVLCATNAPIFAPYTGLFAGMLVALYITFEAPLSGMSINPARSFGSAVVAGNWTSFWIYLVAPPLGMFVAAELYGLVRGRAAVHCAKLHHANSKRCIFCEYQHPEHAPAAQVSEAL